jgi:hypothetical protein
MPRASGELKRKMPEIQIVPYGVTDDFYKLGGILNSREVASAFLAQYGLYLFSWVPGVRDLLDRQKAYEMLRAGTDLKNLAVLLFALGAAMAAVFAFLRHRDR